MYLYTFVFRVCVLILQCKFNQLGFGIFQGGFQLTHPDSPARSAHASVHINRQNIEHSCAAIFNIILTDNMLPLFDRFVCENAKI